MELLAVAAAAAAAAAGATIAAAEIPAAGSQPASQANRQLASRTTVPFKNRTFLGRKSNAFGRDRGCISPRPNFAVYLKRYSVCKQLFGQKQWLV